jgi:NAD(P)-dependent dehydrogenase (short-subunit alcohol dehydrogenase family)
MAKVLIIGASHGIGLETVRARSAPATVFGPRRALPRAYQFKMQTSIRYRATRSIPIRSGTHFGTSTW